MEYIYYVYILMIIVLMIFIGFYIYRSFNKESFTGAPGGYDNFLLADNDGNLNTFSLSQLQTDIQTMINTSLNNYYTKNDIINTNVLKNYYTKDEIDGINKTAATAAAILTTSELNNYVKYGEVFTMSGMYGNKGTIKAQTNNNVWLSDKGLEPDNSHPYKQHGLVINKPPSGVSTDPNKMTGWRDETNNKAIIG